MKKFLMIFFAFFSVRIFSQIVVEENYYNRNIFFPASGGSMKYGLYGYDNPALLSSFNKFDLYISGYQFKKDSVKYQKYGAFAGLGATGFSYVINQIDKLSSPELTYSFAIGDKTFGLGFSYSHSIKKYNKLKLSASSSIGIAYRPVKFLSIGAIGRWFESKNLKEYYAFETAIRPLGNEKISLFGDYVYREKRSSKEPKWSAGCAFEPFDGIRFTGRYYSSKYVNIGAQISLGFISFGNSIVADENFKTSASIYSIRFGEKDRSVISPFVEPRTSLYINLNSIVKERKNFLLDNSTELKDILNKISEVKNLKKVEKIIIKIAEIQPLYIAYELREELKKAKNANKKIIIWIRDADFGTYYLASIADSIYIDPLGTISLQGLALGKTYVKNALEKIGIGVDEWRYYKYKSAFETFSRDNLSEADKEQFSKLIDDIYEHIIDEISKARLLSKEELQRIIDEKFLALPDEALKMNLVDKIVKYENIEKQIKENDKIIIGESGDFFENKPTDNFWGEKPKIAIVYALGGVDENTGMKTAELKKVIDKLSENNKIKAIVLRVNSPGGSAHAAELVSEALKQAMQKGKIIVVSQASVAASGGYWISMNSDAIFADPMTVTGSIGVIGGWFYDKGLNDKLGFSYDYIKKGKSSDLGLGVTYPLIGLTLPARNLTEQEKERIKSYFDFAYTDFVKKVAAGRNKTFDEIEAIAQGRIWSGIEGKKIGLVDHIGGLFDAIEYAKNKANLKNDEFDIEYYPSLPLIDFSFLLNQMFGFQISSDPFIENLKFRARYNGKPLLLTPFDFE